VFSDFDHAIAVAIHAIYALTGLCEDELINAALTNFAFETVSMIWIVSSHDCLIEDGEMADVAIVRAICTYWRAIGEKKQVGVGGHLVATFRAFEAIDMKKGLAVRWRVRFSEWNHEEGRTQRQRRDPHAL